MIRELNFIAEHRIPAIVRHIFQTGEGFILEYFFQPNALEQIPTPLLQVPAIFCAFKGTTS